MPTEVPRPTQPRQLVEYAILGGPRDGLTLRCPNGLWSWSLGGERDPVSGRQVYERYELTGWIGGEVVMKYVGRR